MDFDEIYTLIQEIKEHSTAFSHSALNKNPVPEEFCRFTYLPRLEKNGWLNATFLFGQWMKTHSLAFILSLHSNFR